ncbi:hypothetical protein B0H14DRAFT_2568155 [Mycena olivaceomarginata]|nr:hypothetical protein B0H14DRAFT_2568155 [Mycena olivaceomarginata]
MLQTARKFKLTFDILALSKDVKEELPIYFHMGGNRDMGRRNNSKCAKCLRDFHNLWWRETTKDMADAVIVLVNPVERSTWRMLGPLPVPRGSDKNARLSSRIKPTNTRTHRRRKKENSGALEADDPVLFDMSIHLENQIDGFRIFGVECNPTPAHQLEPLDEEEDQDEETIYIGNSHSLDSDGDSRSAGSIWYNQDDERNTCHSPERDGLSRRRSRSGNPACYPEYTHIRHIELQNPVKKTGKVPDNRSK